MKNKENVIQDIVKQIVCNSKNENNANKLLTELNTAINRQYSILYARPLDAAMAN